MFQILKVVTEFGILVKTGLCLDSILSRLRFNLSRFMEFDQVIAAVGRPAWVRVAGLLD
jgi:hypothetical protein